MDHGGAVGPGNVQSVTTILEVSSILVNWLVEPMCTVLDMAKWNEDWTEASPKVGVPFHTILAIPPWRDIRST